MIYYDYKDLYYIISTHTRKIAFIIYDNVNVTFGVAHAGSNNYSPSYLDLHQKKILRKLNCIHSTLQYLIICCKSMTTCLVQVVECLEG